jgi:hypothetical protein
MNDHSLTAAHAATASCGMVLHQELASLSKVALGLALPLQSNQSQVMTPRGG